MTWRARSFFLTLILTTAASAAKVAAAVAGERPYHVAAGVNVGGGQLDWRINSKWMLEARAQGGEEKGTEKTNASLIGLRGYRFLHVGRPSFFTGLEIASVEAKRHSTNYRASGVAAGLFLGMEFRLIPHVYFLMDAGPYVVSLNEQRTSVTSTSLDFVGDAALVVGF